MANEGLKPAATFLLVLNFCMYVIVAAIGGWALNVAINHTFVIGPDLALPAHFSPIFFPIGNAATGFFVIFALIAGVVGAAATIVGVQHVRSWTYESFPAAASSAVIAWALTILAMGLACKEINLEGRNTRLVLRTIALLVAWLQISADTDQWRTMEAFLIILSATQLLFIAVIHGGATPRA